MRRALLRTATGDHHLQTPAGLPSPGQILLGGRCRWLRGVFWKMKVPTVDARSSSHTVDEKVRTMVFVQLQLEPRFVDPCNLLGIGDAQMCR